MQLYLCEKPSQARDIARVLGLSGRGEGCIEGDTVTVTWAVGHLLELAAPEAYGEQFGVPWRMESLPVLPEKWQMTVKPQTKSQFTVISRLLKRASEVVIATDADREGEVIARELLAYCQYRGPVSRLWLSALDEASVREALANILPGEQTARLYDAGLARGHADWLIGMNLTRCIPLKPGRRGSRMCYPSEGYRRRHLPWWSDGIRRLPVLCHGPGGRCLSDWRKTGSGSGPSGRRQSSTAMKINGA